MSSMFSSVSVLSEKSFTAFISAKVIARITFDMIASCILRAVSLSMFMSVSILKTNCTLY